MERFAARFEASERNSEEIGKRRRECQQRSLRAQRGLEELRLAGEVPSEEQLDEQRTGRDAVWRKIRRNGEAGEALDARQAEAFEAGIRASDDIADRLRREADRVATRAKLRAEYSPNANRRSPFWSVRTAQSLHVEQTCKRSGPHSGYQ